MILGIYGAGSLGREVYELGLDINDASHRWNKILFISDVEVDTAKLHTDVLSMDEFCDAFSADEAEVAIAIGEPEYRELMRKKVQSRGYKLATMIHPSCRISRFAKIEDGVIICYGSNISTDSVIGTNTYIQANAGVGHDSVIGNDCVISACVRIAGDANIGSKAYIGMSSLIREKITVGECTVVAMGSSVMKELPAEVIAMGNPARVIRKNTDHKVF